MRQLLCADALKTLKAMGVSEPYLDGVEIRYRSLAAWRASRVSRMVPLGGGVGLFGPLSHA
jgi:hypothetical protein